MREYNDKIRHEQMLQYVPEEIIQRIDVFDEDEVRKFETPEIWQLDEVIRGSVIVAVDDVQGPEGETARIYLKRPNGAISCLVLGALSELTEWGTPKLFSDLLRVGGVVEVATC